MGRLWRCSPCFTACRERAHKKGGAGSLRFTCVCDCAFIPSAFLSARFPSVYPIIYVQLFHGIMLALFALAATHNGSCFYVEVFSRRYQADIERAFAAVQAEKEQKEREREQQAAASSASAAGASDAAGTTPAPAVSATETAASSSDKPARSPAVGAGSATRSAAGSTMSSASPRPETASTEPMAPNGSILQSLSHAAEAILGGGSAGDSISGSGVSYGLDFGALAGGVLMPDDADTAAAANMSDDTDGDKAKESASTVVASPPASDARRRRARAASTSK